MHLARELVFFRLATLTALLCAAPAHGSPVFYFAKSGEPVVFEQVDGLYATPAKAPGALFRIGPTDIVARAPQNDLPAWPVVRKGQGPLLPLTGKLAVHFSAGVTRTVAAAVLASAGLEVERFLDHHSGELVVARLTTRRDPFATARELADAPGVLFAEPLMLVPIHTHAPPPNDPIFAKDVQLQLREELHHIPSAWKRTTGDAHVIAAILDTGIDASHPDLAENLVGGVDVLDKDGDGSPELGFADDYHGTAVAGVLGAATDNGQGVAGVCWHCGLLAVRMIDSRATIYEDPAKIYDAFAAAVQRGAWVINNSWGPLATDGEGNCIETPFGDVIAEAVEHAATAGRNGRGAIVVWSAGNDACSTSLQAHLQAEDQVVVSALDGFGVAQPYSNHGDEVDVSAVEGNFTTDIKGTAGASDGSDPFLAKFEGIEPADYMRNFRGTSAAAPVVSGALALALGLNPNLTAKQLHQCLRDTAAQTDADCAHGATTAGGHSPCYGFGLLDAEALLARAASGACGGKCEQHEHCVPGTYCDIKTKLCAFGEPEEERPSDAGAQDEPTESGCGCSFIGR